MTVAQTNIQVRISASDKKKFAKILDDVGLDIPSAFRIFVKRVIAAKGVPFRAQKITENGLTFEEEEELLRIIAKAKEYPEKMIGPFKNSESLIKSLNS